MYLKQNILVCKEDETIKFDKLGKAKKHFLIVIAMNFNSICYDCVEYEIDGCSACELSKAFETCKQDLTHAWSLEEIASIANANSKKFFGGNTYLVHKGVR